MSKGRSRIAAILVGLSVVFAPPVFGQASAPGNPASLPASGVPTDAASAPEMKLKGAANERQRGTIATITELAQQLKVEQLKRDLREAKQTAAAASGGDAAMAKVGALPLPGASPAAPISAHPLEHQPPVVSAIFGMGGRLRARLQDGRELIAGQEAQGWTVNTVTPTAVSFTHCPPKRRGAKTECVTKLVAPNGI